jgi:transcriptional regulator with XRE-family HTH domain
MTPRHVLSNNLKLLMQEHPPLNTIKKLTAASGISNGTLDRIRRAEGSTTVDVLEPLAAAFGLEAWELLVPRGKWRLLHQLRLVAEAAASYTVTVDEPGNAGAATRTRT